MSAPQSDLISTQTRSEIVTEIVHSLNTILQECALNDEDVDCYYIIPFTLGEEGSLKLAGVLWFNGKTHHTKFLLVLCKHSEELRDANTAIDQWVEGEASMESFMRNYVFPERTCAFEFHYKSLDDIPDKLCDLAAGLAAEVVV